MSLVQGIKGDSAVQARSLYRQLLRQSEQFAAYNFREYAKRRTRDAFRECKEVHEPREIQEMIQKGLKELQMMKRQTVVSQFFQLDRLVVEGGKTGKQSGKRNDIVRQKDTGLQQYGGVLYERKGANLDHFDFRPTSGCHYLLPPLPEQTHLYARIPLTTQRLRDRVRTLFEPAQPEQTHLYVRIPLTTQRLRDRVRALFEPSQENTMAPGYRANNQSRRANRSYVDHDVFEGLPVRNWRRDTVTIAPPPVHEIATQKDKWDVELPWGMPKDSHLLPQHSQDLLRAARSGRLYVRRPPAEEEEVDAETTLGDKPEKKEEDPKEKGFSVKTWKLVPKHQEGPEIEFLAKRRKGLTGSAIKTALIPGPAMTKARVKRTDATGNIYFEDVVVPEGQALDGELISQTVIADSVVGKSAIDSIPALSTPPRRRPPPPKRKAKGPGRGRKRKLPLAPTSVPGEPGVDKLEAESKGTGVQNDNVATEGIKREDSDTVNIENENEDAEMGDDNLNQSDEEGEEASDDDEQSEGEGQGEHDEDEAENTEAKHRELTCTETNESADMADEHVTGQDRERDASSSPELPLSTMGSMVGHEHGPAGSPLRNVVTFAPTFEERSPDLISDGEAEAEGDEDETVHDNIHENLQGEVEDSDMQGAYQMPQDEGFTAGNGMPMEQNQDYIDDDEMLLNDDISNMDFDPMSIEHGPYPEPYPDDDEEIMPIPVQEQQDQINSSDPQSLNQESHFPAQTNIADQPALGPSEGAREEGEEEEDNFVDLLGSLEDHLNEHGPGPEAEQADENPKSEDEVDHVAVPDQFQATFPVAPEIAVGAEVHPAQEELPDAKAATGSEIVEIVAHMEAEKGRAEEPKAAEGAEEAEALAPVSTGD